MRFLFVMALVEAFGAGTGLETPRCEITEQGGNLSAVGTWFDMINKRPVSDVLDGAGVFDAATTSISCKKKLRLCVVADARVQDGRLSTWVRVYTIHAWKPGHVQAVLSDGCVQLTLVIEEPSNKARMTRAVLPPCSRNPHWTPGTFELGDGTAE